jgi:hypothetical protein
LPGRLFKGGIAEINVAIINLFEYMLVLEKNRYNTKRKRNLNIIKMINKQSGFTQFWPISILLAINILIGLITFRDYGKSFDEDSIQYLATQSLIAYKTGITPNFGSLYDNLNNYGPSYNMVVYLAIQVFVRIFPGIAITDLWHFAYFLTFQVGVLCLYLLAKRWLSNWAALGVAILFLTQPLLWGHAFINPKDIPFMTFFLASIVSGLYMCDKVFISNKEPIRILSIKTLKTKFIRDWQKMPKKPKRYAIVISVCWLLSVAILVIGGGVINNWIAIILQKMYIADPQSLLGRLFRRFALHATTIPVQDYIYKAQVIFRSIKDVYFILGLIFMVWLYRFVLPWSFHLPQKKSVLLFFKEFSASFAKPPIIIAGVILGLTTSLRIIGPLAGLIIVAYAIIRKKNVLAYLLTYGILALAIMYFTWPYLWSDPIKNLINSLTMMSSYPWSGTMLFNGNFYHTSEVPWYFLLTMLSIQFTEPVIIFFGIGIIITGYTLLVKRNIGLFGLSLVWFIIPVGAIIITRRPIYDNFRQLLFLIPPIFLICGVALDALFSIAHKWFFKLIILTLAIFPGIYGIVQLHPYEYIYYNYFVGGVRGAFRIYENDYWYTSFREAAEYINSIAPQGAKIVSWGDPELVKQYARKDLIVGTNVGSTINLTGSYDFAVLSSRQNNDYLYPLDKPIFSVERDGAILVVVKKLSPNSSP